MDVLTRRALALAALVLAACDPDLGEPGAWIAADEIAAPFTPEVGAPPSPTAARPTDVIRVVTFNVQKGADAERIARAIGEHPDLAAASIILLQEQESHPSEGASRTARLAEALGLNYVYAPASERGEGSHGLAILSAFPIEDVEVMKLPLSAVSQPRIAIRANIRMGTRVLPVINLHLGAVLNVTDRILQLRPAVLDHDSPLLVAGDFNTSPYVWQHGAVPLLPAGAVADTDQAPIVDDYMRVIGFDAPTADLGPTQHMLGVESRLDSFYSAGLLVTPGGVAREVDVSDHWPLWVDVTLVPQNDHPM